MVKSQGKDAKTQNCLTNVLLLLQHQFVNKLLYYQRMLFVFVQDLYTARSDLGNLLKALGRLDEAKVGSGGIFALGTVSLYGIPF